MRALLLLASLAIASCAPVTRQAVSPAPPAIAAQPAAIATANPPIGAVTLRSDTTLGAGVALAPRLATLSQALTAAGLLETLNAPGAFTLFAPVEEAFGRLAPGTAAVLLKPENGASLTKLLQLHLVPGRLTSADLVSRVQAGGGRATLTTLAGETLILTLTGSVVTLADAGGNLSYVEVADIRQANGVLHVVNGVLIPRIN